jgi:hypothetical protein
MPGWRYGVRLKKRVRILWNIYFKLMRMETLHVLRSLMLLSEVSRKTFN